MVPLGSTDRGAALGDSDLVYALNSQDGLDNTKVDMERERASWVENSVKYEATLRFINSQARALMDAMKSPNQG
jgi:flagellar basal-body rod protein FlgB